MRAPAIQHCQTARPGGPALSCTAHRPTHSQLAVISLGRQLRSAPLFHFARTILVAKIEPGQRLRNLIGEISRDLVPPAEAAE